MSWLFIDTSVRERIRFARLPTNGRVLECVKRGRQPLVAVLSSFIDANELSSYDGIVVVAGPGPFSAVRSGVLIANLLSRVYHIPLYGVRVEESRDLEKLRNALASQDMEPSSYVAPIYDQEPNITCQDVS